MPLQLIIVIGTIVIIFALLLYTVWVFKDKKVVYEISAIVYNSKKEIMLIYDQELGRLSIPHVTLKNDEIPSKVVSELINSSCSYATDDYYFSRLFHAKTNKYDRIRDDVAPALILDETTRFRKKCCLYYVVELSDTAPVSSRERFPYPEFFSKHEIDEMDTSTCPIDYQRSVLCNVFDRIA